MLILEKIVSLGKHWNRFLEGVGGNLLKFKDWLGKHFIKKVLGRVESVLGAGSLQGL